MFLLILFDFLFWFIEFSNSYLTYISNKTSVIKNTLSVLYAQSHIGVSCEALNAWMKYCKARCVSKTFLIENPSKGDYFEMKGNFYAKCSKSVLWIKALYSK